MKTLRGRWYRNVCLLLCVLGCSACASAPDPMPPSFFPAGPTEVDLDRGSPLLIDRYHRPRIEHLYMHDQTEVDLAAPLPNRPTRSKGKASPR